MAQDRREKPGEKMNKKLFLFQLLGGYRDDVNRCLTKGTDRGRRAFSRGNFKRKRRKH